MIKIKKIEILIKNILFFKDVQNYVILK